MSDEAVGQVESFRSLEEVMKWAFAQKPPAELFTVIAQDEYTHDVVIRVSPELFLSFDTT